MDLQMPRPGLEHDNHAGHWIGTETRMPSPWSPEQSERQGEIHARVLDAHDRPA